MNYNLEIQKKRLQAEEIKVFEDKVKVLKEAIQIADQHHDIDWGFDLRLELIRYERNTANCNESFPAFAWILNASDTHTDYFEEADFLWEYKWMFNSAYRNSLIPEVQINEIGADLKRRLQRNGYTLRAYYNVMTNWAQHKGDFEAAADFIALAEAEMEDDMSNCPACELDSKVENELMLGYFDQAIITGQDLIQGKLTCYSMPFQTYCCLAYYLLRGNDARAQHYFEKALEEYERSDQYDHSVLFALSILTYYMFKTDQSGYWELFEKIAAWEVGAEDVLRFHFAMHVLPLLKNGGTKQMELSSQVPYYNPEGIYDLKELYTYYEQIAFHLANQFDKRNGTSFFKDDLVQLMQE